MGGGRNGHFWGAPIFGQNPGKYIIFPQKDAKSGRPKNSRSYHHPSHPPVDALLEEENAQKKGKKRIGRSGLRAEEVGATGSSSGGVARFSCDTPPNPGKLKGR